MVAAAEGVHSTLSGDIVRTLLRDADGKTVSFDWPIDDASSNGYVNSLWVHLVLSVDNDAVNVYVDGAAVTNFGYQTDGRSFKADTDQNLAFPAGPGMLSDTLGRFPVGATYTDDEDYWVPVSLAPGAHVFHAVDTFGDGWQGGYVELMDSSGNVVFGGPEDGAPEEDGADYNFNVPAGQTQAFTVHLKTGRWASEYAWSIDAGSVLNDDGTLDTTNGYSGPPATHAIVVGDGGRSGFTGSINTMALHRSPQSAEDAGCLYEFGKAWIALCADPTGTWSVDWLVSDELGDSGSLMGDATFDGAFGLVFDGDGDYAEYSGDDVIQYAADASFGISLWFTRQSCTVHGGFYEMIFAHQVGDASWWDIDDTHIYIMVGCADAGTHSTVGGNIVRTEMTDGGGNQLAFDWSIPTGSAESYTNAWVHMVLSVSPTSINVYADGERVTDFGYEIPRTDWGDSYQPLLAADNLANPDPGALTAELQGFTLQGYADNSDYIIEVILSPGIHTFHAVDQFGDGWQGGYFEVGYVLGAMVAGQFMPARNPTVLVGGLDPVVAGVTRTGPGTVVTDGQHLSFRVADGETRVLQVHIKTGEWASEYSWSMDDGSDFSGPPAPNPLKLGGTGGGYSSFFGSIGAVSLHRSPPSEHDAQCMFEFGQGLIAMCEDYTAENNWRVDWLLLNGTMSDQVTMNDDAYLDGSFGAVLDGRGDSLTVVGDTTTYASDGTFGISFWFTKHECTTPGRYEMLWRHEQDGWRSSSVHVYIGCDSAGIGSTIDGDIIRTRLIDGDGKSVEFDWGVSAERGNGAINAEWVHFVLSVDHDSVQAFVDGKPITNYGYSLSSRSSAQTADNLAWPDGPTMLTDRLGGFPIGSGYEPRSDYYQTIELTAGEHSFSAWADWGSWHGGWFSIMTQAGELLTGGEDDKPDRNENVYTFQVQQDNSMDLFTGKMLLTLRITTGRWSGDLSWAVDADAVAGALYTGPPPSHSITIGGTGYIGSVNSISIHRSPPDQKDAECLYDYGMQYLATCSDFTDNMIIANDMVSDDVSFVGNAFVDGKMGVRLDGDNDAIVVDGPSTYYASSGEFSISMWVTKNECVKPGGYEMLWSHEQFGGWQGWREGSSIHMYVNCGSEGDSTLNGDLIRTILRDNNDNNARFDFKLSEAADNGYINANWFHIVLSVSHDSIQVFLDGKAVNDYGYRTARCAMYTDCTDCGNCPTDGGPRISSDTCVYMGTPGAVSNDGDCDDPEEQSAANPAWCGATAMNGVCTTAGAPLALSATLGGFAMGGYADNSDYYVDMLLEAGDHIFHAQDTFGDGWQGGWFEITQVGDGCMADSGIPVTGRNPPCQCHYTCASCGYTGDSDYNPDAGDCITCADGSAVTPIWADGTGTCSYTGNAPPARMTPVGGAQTGTVGADYGHFAFTIPVRTTVTLHLHTGDWAVEYKWWVEGAGCGETQHNEALQPCAGPIGHSLNIGGSVRDSGVSGEFFGAVSVISVHNEPLDAQGVDCLNKLGSGMIEICENPTTQWTNEFVYFNGSLYNNAQLNGDAYIDPRAGVIVDGDGDAIVVGGDLAATYAPDGDFSISMWFTRKECTSAGRLEMLYAHDTDSNGYWWGGDESNIHIYIGCAEQGTHSTLDGDIVRTLLADRAGNRVSFDWPVSAELTGGLVNNMWVHMVLSVKPDSVRVFADGQPITEYGFSVGSRSSGWVTTDANLAYPDGPVALPQRLQGFGMGSAYAWNEDYYIPLVVPPGDHTFHGWSTSAFGSSWNGGYFELFGTNGELLAGGSDMGKVRGDDDDATYNAATTQNDFDFTIPAGQTVTLHIRTARWANYMQWSISADPSLNAHDPVFAGPPAGEPFYVGGDGGGRSFSGTIATVAINRRGMGAKEAQCLYEFGLNNIEICQDPSRRMHHLVFNGNTTGDGFRDDNMAMMYGDAHFEGSKLMLDGLGDLASVSGETPLSYSNGGDFSLSMWFTRKECFVPGQQFEQLYYHDSAAAIAGVSDSKVSIYIGCSDPGRGGVSTLTGDVVRTVLEDTMTNRATFDWSISAERTTGLINQNWVHMLLSVNNAPGMTQPYVQVFIDGFAVTNYGFPPSAANAMNMAYTCGATTCMRTQLNLNSQMGAFGMGGYADRMVYHKQLTALTDGDHEFTGMDSSGDGWEGGYYTICINQCDPAVPGSSVAGGTADGRPTGRSTTFPTFTVTAGQQLWLMVNTGDYASEVSWEITGSDFAYPPTDGTGSSAVFLGGCDPVTQLNQGCTAGPFLGSIGMVSLIYGERDEREADCIYQWSQDYIDLCPDPISQRGTSFALRWADGATPDGLTLSGSGATVSAPMPGLNLDGTGYAMLNGGGFAAGDGDYTLSVWFTKSVCDSAPTSTFTVLAQDEIGDKSASYITAQIVCGGQDSTLGGSVVRVAMQDVNGVMAAVDLPLNNSQVLSGGVITDEWVNLAWAATNGDNDSPTAVTFYVDGSAVPANVIGWPLAGQATNIAHLATGGSPAMFSAQFGDFNMDSSYPSDTDSFATIDGLSPMTTYTFTGYDEWGDGWDQGGWWEVIVPAIDVYVPNRPASVTGERIAGGPIYGLVEGDGGDPVSFTLPQECGAAGLCTVTVRVVAHRAGDEISWELREQPSDTVVGFGPDRAPMYLGAMPMSPPSSAPCARNSMCAPNGQVLGAPFVGQLGGLVAWRWDQEPEVLDCVYQSGPM